MIIYFLLFIDFSVLILKDKNLHKFFMFAQLNSQKKKLMKTNKTSDFEDVMP